MRRRLLVSGLLALVAPLVLAIPASAHVGIDPSTATKGGYTTLTFKVPNEQESANTTKIQVGFPTDHPLASVAVEPIAGWTYTVEKAKLAKPITTDDGEVTEAVSSITWVGVIKPGEFQRLTVSVGPLPDDVDQLTFPTIQTYSNGEVVRWVDPSVEGQPEPEHPAPTVALSAATPADHATTTTEVAPGTSAVTTSVAAASTSSVAKSDVDQAQTMGVVGIVVGAVALLAAAAALVRRKGSGSPS